MAQSGTFYLAATRVSDWGALRVRCDILGSPMSRPLFAFFFSVLATNPAFQLAIAQSGGEEIVARTQHYRPSTGLTLRTSVEMVEVPVVVRDNKRRAVAGLTREDFTLFDLGKRQEIGSFTVENFAPSPSAAAPNGREAVVPAAKPLSQRRFVVLCFDDITMDPGSTVRAKAAAKQFVQTALGPDDLVSIVTTAFRTSTDFTSDRSILLAAIDKVFPGMRSPDAQASQCPPIRPYEAYLLANSMDSNLLQAKIEEFRACATNPPRPELVIQALARSIWEEERQNSNRTLLALDSLVGALAKLQGRRMILMASSGFYSGNMEGDENILIRHAIEAGVVINTLGARGLYTIIPGGDASAPPSASRTMRGRIAEVSTQSTAAVALDDGLAVVASGTGGSFFHNNNDLVKGFRELGAMPEVIYVLGFAPTDIAPDGRFHNLKVRVKGGYAVQARMGYSAPPKPGSVKQPNDPTAVDGRMADTVVVSDAPAELVWVPQKEKGGITLVAKFNMTKLKFEMRQKRHSQSITLVALLRDEKGVTVAGERSDVDLSLTDSTYDSFVKAGSMNVALTVKAPPGAYTVRGLVIEGLGGKAATSNAQVLLP